MHVHGDADVAHHSGRRRDRVGERGNRRQLRVDRDSRSAVDRGRRLVGGTAPRHDDPRQLRSAGAAARRPAGVRRLGRSGREDGQRGTIGGTLNGLTGRYVAIYYCPSDQGDAADQTVGNYQRRRGNYVVNWGNSKYGQNPEPVGKAPFSHIRGNRTMPRDTKFADITDGTSSTLMMSEVLRAWSPQDNDWRGDIHNDDGVCRFHTTLSPNTSAPDVIESGWFQRTGDPTMPAVAGARNAQVAAARSRHPGGVNAVLCDASVRFIGDSIALDAWQAMGSMNGEEVAEEE